MAKESEFKKGEKGYLQRFVNIFKKDAEIAIHEFESSSEETISEVVATKITLENEIHSLKKNIAGVEEKEHELSEKLEEVSRFYSGNFEENEDGVVIADEIASYVEKFEGYKTEIDELRTEIEEYKRELFGSEDEEGKRVKGLDHKIESLKTQLQNNIESSQGEIDVFFAENHKRRDELFFKIEGLLKGASTVALAKAFKEHKDSFNTINSVWLGLFVASIISMMAISAWGFVHSKYEFQDMWKYTLGNLPFIGGAIWLAVYSSKQRSQNKRLQQEYAFKEDVAKIYYGLKEEIEELGDSELGAALNEAILKLVIDVVGLNPSVSLDSTSHNDKGPILESIQNLAEAIKSVKTPTG